MQELSADIIYTVWRIEYVMQTGNIIVFIWHVKVWSHWQCLMQYIM